MKKNIVLRYVLIAFLSAILTISKLSLSFLPNIEPVTLFLIIYSLVFGFRVTLLIVMIFILTEGYLYGLNLYFIQYLFVWPLLVIVTNILKKYIKENFFIWAIYAGAYGMLFGTLCAIPLMIFDKTFAFSSIISGILFDAIHLVGNYFLMLLLGEIIYNRLKSLYKNLGGYHENLYKKWG